jgi:predicted dehydrogenase
MARMTDRLRVGLVGAGPWASAVHAPVLAAHPGTELVGVWARRPDAAEQLATPLGASAFDDVKALIDAVDVMAFAVPPQVQSPLAITAANAGRHLILEKPVANTVDDAIELADAVGAAGVASIVMLVLRFAPETATWLNSLRFGEWYAGSARWLAGSLLGGPYAASPWRQRDGAVNDIGPHTLDLLDAALGPITEVLAATYSEPDVWQLILGHESGATSTATMSMRLPMLPTVAAFEVYGSAGLRALDPRASSATDSYAAMVDDLVAMIHDGRREHPCDVHRGLHLQRLIATARDKAGR